MEACMTLVKGNHYQLQKESNQSSLVSSHLRHFETQQEDDGKMSLQKVNGSDKHTIAQHLCHFSKQQKKIQLLQRY
jgi:hypothetical protein